MAMKHVEDYSVGDWVLCTEDGFNKPMRIDRIGRHHISLESNTEGKISGIQSMVDVEPLPLTEEVLRISGFEKQSTKYDCYAIRGKAENVVGVNLTDCTLHIDWNGSGIDIGCRYVHELQRALRCCGLYGLANNFMIE